MKTTIESITPAMARTLLERHLKPDRQRPMSESVVESYARAMRAGHWILTHQGIAIDDEGELVDGQHRLSAVAISGVTVKMMVTRDIPHNGKSDDVLTIDVIDRGHERGVGQQLQLRHGVTNGNLTAGVLRGILWLAAQSRKLMVGKFQVGFAMRVMDHYGDEVNYCISNRSRDFAVRNAPVIAASAFAMKGCPDSVKPFYTALATGEGLRAGDPALTARRVLMQHQEKSGTMLQYRYVLTCAMKAVNKEKLTKLYDTDHGYNYFLEMQRRTVRRLLAECGFPE
jgi:hypothetical protein